MKTVLITGSEGMIGKELKILLHKNKNINLRFADLKLGQDLTIFDVCMNQCGGVDEVYHLAGVKGSAKMTKEQPAYFLVPMLRYNTNMLEAARRCKVKKFLYTSSIAVENLKTDFYPATAKLMGEHQINAYKIQYSKGTKFCIVRPSNVYGRFDNIHNTEAMVITSLLRKALFSEVINVMGDGSPIRDFINAEDVAKGMLQCMKVMPEIPINLCSGTGVSIKEVAGIISKVFNKKLIFEKRNKYGAKSRVMKFNGQLIKWKPYITLEKGIQEIKNYIGGL